MFGGGPYSTAGGKMAREVGKPQRTLAEITIKRRQGGMKVGRVFRAGVVPPFMPEKITDDYHPSGNSVCYMIQTAHLMGCDPIYLIGFTLESGTPYHFGKQNPVTRRGAFYDTEPPMLWLRWYQERYPGRVRLVPGFSGPIYDVFETDDWLCGVDDEEEAEGRTTERHEPEAHGQDRQATSDSERRPEGQAQG